MHNGRLICVSCIAFVVALLVAVPTVFVWNLFLNGQGSFNWVVSLALSGSVAGALWLVLHSKQGRQRW